jgi:hypothetical protein
MFPRHAREHGQDEAAPEHDRQVDTQQAGRLLVRAGSFRLQRLEFREQTLATVEQPLAVGREAHLPGRPVKELHAQRLLQARDRLGQRRG